MDSRIRQRLSKSGTCLGDLARLRWRQARLLCRLLRRRLHWIVMVHRRGVLRRWLILRRCRSLHGVQHLLHLALLLPRQRRLVRPASIPFSTDDVAVPSSLLR
jgi:hypothetical protein